MEQNIVLKKDDIINNQSIKDICKNENIKEAALFGSYVKNEQNEESDVDLLIKLNGKKSLIRIIRISQKFSKVLNKKVDLLTAEAISPHLKKYIFNELEVFYKENEK
jgi:uncharacterized protein